MRRRSVKGRPGLSPTQKFIIGIAVTRSGCQPPVLSPVRKLLLGWAGIPRRCRRVSRHISSQRERQG